MSNIRYDAEFFMNRERQRIQKKLSETKKHLAEIKGQLPFGLVNMALFFGYMVSQKVRGILRKIKRLEQQIFTLQSRLAISDRLGGVQ